MVKKFVSIEKQDFIKLIIPGVLLFIFMIGGHFTQPGKVRLNNKTDHFDTHRALERIEFILGDEQPHPVDSPANDQIRERLLQQIESLGLTPIITSSPICYSRPTLTYNVCTQVKNVSFMLKPNVPEVTNVSEETQKGNVILATSHYDSVGAGPGAGDAQMGVAVLLEAAFHLSKEERKRPILFLITDGEEAGLLGARAFAQFDPRMQTVSTIINFEARGTSGPAYMFETSQPNGRVIPAFMKRAKSPAANSVMAAVYERLPNSTDVAVYLPDGYEALNFAVIGNETYYHTPLDNLENLSLPSLQHMGDLGLSTLRTFSQDEDAFGNDNKLIYSDIFTMGMIALPQWVSIPVLGLGVIAGLLGFWQVSRLSSDRLSIAYKIRVFVTPLLIVGVAGLLSYGLQFTIGAFRVEPDYWRAYAWASHGWSVMVAIISAFIVPKFMGSKVNRLHLLTIGWVWFCIFGLVLAWLLPGAAILFVPAAILFIVGVFSAIFGMPKAIILEIAAALIALVFLVPTVTTLGTAMGYDIAFVISILTALALLPWIAVLTPITKPDQPQTLTQSLKHSLPLYTGLSVLIGFVVLSAILPAYSKKLPRHLNIVTLIDHDLKKAFVTFGGGSPLPKGMEEAGKFSGPDNIIPAVSGRVWHHESDYGVAISSQGEGPKLTVLKDFITENGEREVIISLALQNTQRLDIRIPDAAQLKSFEFDGITQILSPTDQSRNDKLFRCLGQSCHKKSLKFTLGNPKSHEWIINASQYGAGETGAAFAKGRPAEAIPRQAGDRVVHIKRIQL